MLSATGTLYAAASQFLTILNKKDKRLGICQILQESKTVCVVGISDNPTRDSGSIALFLKEKGFAVTGVHPTLRAFQGIQVFPDIRSVPGDIDILDIFISGDRLHSILPEIILKKPKILWLQFNVYCPEAVQIALNAGITVVQNKCIAIEYRNCA
jgi:predicted CoA-binding protein